MRLRTSRPGATDAPKHRKSLAAIAVVVAMAAVPAIAFAQGADDYQPSPPPQAPSPQGDPSTPSTPAPAPAPDAAPGAVADPAPAPGEPSSDGTVVPGTPGDTLPDTVTESSDPAAEALDVEAGKAAVRRFRDGVLEFDAAIREISFPEDATDDVDALLDENRQLLTDQKAFRGVESADQYNELVLDLREGIEDHDAALSQVESALGL